MHSRAEIGCIVEVILDRKVTERHFLNSVLRNQIHRFDEVAWVEIRGSEFGKKITYTKFSNFHRKTWSKLDVEEQTLMV